MPVNRINSCFLFGLGLILLSGMTNARADDVRQCEIDQKESVVVIRVYKEGKLSALGDNHLISTSQLEGALTFNSDRPELSNILLSVPTQSLIVNDPALRAKAEEGFNSKVGSFNRKITRKSMLGKKVLYAKKYPYINLESLQLPAQLNGEATMRVTLRGTSQDEEVEITTQFGNNVLQITGQFYLTQSDYGIAPFSIMFGGIRVKDALRLDFDVRAKCPAF